MKYFYTKKTEKIGPLSFEELLNADIERTTLIWREGQDDWSKAETFPELKSKFESVPPEIPLSTVQKAQGIASRELEANFKLLLLSFALTFVAYMVIGEMNKPPYLTNQELQEMKEYLNSHRGDFSVSVGKWIGDSKYDDNIPLASLPNINEIRKNRYSRDVNSKTFTSFFVILGFLVLGRYIIKASN